MPTQYLFRVLLRDYSVCLSELCRVRVIIFRQINIFKYFLLITVLRICRSFFKFLSSLLSFLSNVYHTVRIMSERNMYVHTTKGQMACNSQC